MNGRRSASVGVLTLLTLALAGCGGGGQLAKVGDRSITRDQVDRMVEHASEEAKRANADFPAKGTDGYRELQQEAVAILVSRAQIVLAAKRMGIAVTQQ